MRESEALAVLGAKIPYDKTSLKIAYKQACRKWHPDVAKRNGITFEEANAKMAEINHAYALLLSEAETAGTVTGNDVVLRTEEPSMTREEAERYEYDPSHKWDGFQHSSDWSRGWYGTEEGKQTIDDAHRNGYFPNEDVQQGMLDYHYDRSYYQKKMWGFGARGYKTLFPWPWAFHSWRYDTFMGLDRINGKMAYRRDSEGYWISDHTTNSSKRPFPVNGTPPHPPVSIVIQGLLFLVFAVLAAQLVLAYQPDTVRMLDAAFAVAFSFMAIRTIVGLYMGRNYKTEWRIWHQCATLLVLCLLCLVLSVALAAVDPFGGMLSILDYMKNA